MDIISFWNNSYGIYNNWVFLSFSHRASNLMFYVGIRILRMMMLGREISAVLFPLHCIKTQEMMMACNLEEHSQKIITRLEPSLCLLL